MKISKFNEMVGDGLINLQDYIDQTPELNSLIKKTVEAKEKFGDHVRSFGKAKDIDEWENIKKNLFSEYSKIKGKTLSFMPDISRIDHMKIYDTILTTNDVEFLDWEFDLDYYADDMRGTHRVYVRYSNKPNGTIYSQPSNNIWLKK